MTNCYEVLYFENYQSELVSKRYFSNSYSKYFTNYRRSDARAVLVRTYKLSLVLAGPRPLPDRHRQDLEWRR